MWLTLGVSAAPALTSSPNCLGASVASGASGGDLSSLFVHRHKARVADACVAQVDIAGHDRPLPKQSHAALKVGGLDKHRRDPNGVPKRPR